MQCIAIRWRLAGPVITVMIPKSFKRGAKMHIAKHLDAGLAATRALQQAALSNPSNDQ